MWGDVEAGEGIEFLGVDLPPPGPPWTSFTCKRLTHMGKCFHHVSVGEMTEGRACWVSPQGLQCDLHYICPIVSSRRAAVIQAVLLASLVEL